MCDLHGLWEVWQVGCVDKCVCVRICVGIYMCSACMYNVVILWWFNGMVLTIQQHTLHIVSYTHTQKDTCCSVHLSLSSTLKHSNTLTPPPHISFTSLSPHGHTKASRLCHDTHSTCLYWNTHKNTQHAETAMHTQSVVMVTHKQH